MYIIYDSWMAQNCNSYTPSYHISQPTITVDNDSPQNVLVVFKSTFEGPFFDRITQLVAPGNQATFTSPPLPQGREQGSLEISVGFGGFDPFTGGPNRMCRKLIDYTYYDQTHTVKDIITAGITRGLCWQQRHLSASPKNRQVVLSNCSARKKWQ